MPYVYALCVCLICVCQQVMQRFMDLKLKEYEIVMCMPYVYALCVCLTCMPYVYALRVCLMCMPYVYALYVYVNR